MKLIDAVTCVGPIIPKILVPKLEIKANYPLNEREASLFSKALNALLKQFEEENINISNLMRLTALVTEDGDFTLSINPEHMGSQIALVVYPVKRWRDNSYNDGQILICIIEELCHHYWAIEDEILVTYKVHEVMKQIYPDVQHNQLYNLQSCEG